MEFLFSISYLAMRKAVRISKDTIGQCDCGHYVDAAELVGEWQDVYDPERCPYCAEKKLRHADWLMNYYGVSQ